ncbi:UNVERIFIED_CONTAM: hypothetical protein Slati_0981100 [Sesamum latifolium]|uniref:Gag-asp_proteas domain-containing protein n=1 Tax=Sesamum latifolium TaxID=2727402 RepID=A0AAW2XTG1_9LAMI
MVDAASGGALIDKTPEEAQHLISTMAENYRQYGYHIERGVSMVNEDGGTTLTSAIGIQASNQNHTHRSSTDLHLLKLHLKHRIQLATSFSQLAAQSSGKLPSQTESNPRENVSAMTLRSGKELKPVEPTSTKAKEGGKSLEHADSHTDKELCTNKRKLNDNERIIFSKNVSAVINRKLPEKCKDPGMFTLSCIIGNKRIKRAMLDLGASINVMPYSVYQALILSTLQDTNVIIQLADRSYVRPMGLVEDVLVKVNDLLVPVDFYILKMGT